MSDATIKLEIVGQLDPDATLFVFCMQKAGCFPANSFNEYASRVESLVEMHENIGCQRMMHEREDAGET